MKKYIVKSNLIHNGKSYEQNSEIKESEQGFKELLASGHIIESGFAPKQAEQEPVIEEKPAKKPAK